MAADRGDSLKYALAKTEGADAAACESATAAPRTLKKLRAATRVTGGVAVSEC